MSTTTVKLLQAASEIAGGPKALAERLGIGETLLSTFMADRRELPDRLLLRAVDVILEDRESRLPGANRHRPAHPPLRPGLLHEAPEIQENSGRGSGATSGAGAG
jgi:hypothetical protein